MTTATSTLATANNNGDLAGNDSTAGNGASIKGSGRIPVTLTHAESEEAIRRFQEFLRFETISATSPSTGAYRECAAFLLAELRELDFLTDVHFLPEAPDHSPVVVAHWRGLDPSLPVLLLNSHYDVVPADVGAWTVPPFAAVRRGGKIYGRGAQDMKCVCMQYIEALRRLHQLHPQWRPERSLYLTFVPDEEIGGSGMAAFLDSDLYRNGMPGIALALDEGLASTTDVFDVFYGERLPWWIEVKVGRAHALSCAVCSTFCMHILQNFGAPFLTCTYVICWSRKATGPTGHGSRFIENTAVEQLLELSQKALAFRRGQKEKLEMKHGENCTHAVVAKKKAATTLGDVTSLNITTIQAGVAVGDTFAYNVVPSTATCSLDIRISPNMNPQEMKDLLDAWCMECSSAPEAGSKVTWSSIVQSDNSMIHATTETDRTVNPWYGAFCDALNDLGCEISPQIFPAATDSRFLRLLGIRALGFSPMRDTEILLHEHDEYILESNFLEGIEVYVALIRALASQGEEIDRLVDKKRKMKEGSDTNGAAQD
jgi:aminoacylase